MKIAPLAAACLAAAPSCLFAATYSDASLWAQAMGGSPGDGYGAAISEEFEGYADVGDGTTPGAASLDFGGFSVSATRKAGGAGAPVKIMSSPYYGASNATPGGSKYLYLDSDIGLVGLLATFTLSTDAKGFSFHYINANHGTNKIYLSVNGERIELLKNGKYSPSFFGYVGTSPVKSFSVDTGTDSALAFDGFSYRISGDAPAPVPLPAAGLLLAGACAAASAVARRSKR